MIEAAQLEIELKWVTIAAMFGDFSGFVYAFLTSSFGGIALRSVWSIMVMHSARSRGTCCEWRGEYNIASGDFKMGRTGLG